MSRALCYVQVCCVAPAALIIDIPVILWRVAAFSRDRPDEIITVLNDVGWMIFVVGFVPYVAWAISVGLAILSHTAAESV